MLFQYQVVVALMLHTSLCTVQSKRIDAAFNANGRVVFISGSEAISFMNGAEEIGKPKEVQVLNNYLANANHHWRAALYSNDDRKLILLGDGKYQQLDFYPFLPLSEPPGNFVHPFTSDIKDGKPDAAVRIGNTDYVLKDCHYFVYKDNALLAGPIQLPKEIPCLIDAVWRSEVDDGSTVFLRGDTIWFLHPSGKVSGPFKFTNYYDIKSWHIEPVHNRYYG